MKLATFALVAFVTVPAFTRPIAGFDSCNACNHRHSVDPRCSPGSAFHEYPRANFLHHLKSRLLLGLDRAHYFDYPEDWDVDNVDNDDGFDDDAAFENIKEKLRGGDIDDGSTFWDFKEKLRGHDFDWHFEEMLKGHDIGDDSTLWDSKEMLRGGDFDDGRFGAQAYQGNWIRN